MTCYLIPPLLPTQLPLRPSRLKKKKASVRWHLYIPSRLKRSLPSLAMRNFTYLILSLVFFLCLQSAVAVPPSLAQRQDGSISAPPPNGDNQQATATNPPPTDSITRTNTDHASTTVTISTRSAPSPSNVSQTSASVASARQTSATASPSTSCPSFRYLRMLNVLSGRPRQSVAHQTRPHTCYGYYWCSAARKWSGICHHWHQEQMVMTLNLPGNLDLQSTGYTSLARPPISPHWQSLC